MRIMFCTKYFAKIEVSNSCKSLLCVFKKLKLKLAKNTFFLVIWVSVFYKNCFHN